MVAPFEHGRGRVHHGDSEWPAKGPDMGVGTRVRITGAEGSDLLVEPVTVALPDADQATRSSPGERGLS